MANNKFRLYMHDLEANEAVEVGIVEVDKKRDAWVRLNSDVLASALGVADIDGLALLRDADFKVANADG